MTTQEKIEVMKAYIEGKKIQYRLHGEWIDIPSKEPAWDWASFDYRIKPKEKYRPYKDKKELETDFFKNYPMMNKRYRPSIWVVLPHGTEFQIEGFSDDGKCVLINNDFYSMKELLGNFKYLDGFPCGIKED